jgi:hypothetical protein
MTAARVRVCGTLQNNTLALSSDPSSVQVLALANPYTFGVQQTLVILLNFQDKATQPYTLASAQDVTFNQTSSFYVENSYGQSSLNGTAVSLSPSATIFVQPGSIANYTVSGDEQRQQRLRDSVVCVERCGAVGLVRSPHAAVGLACAGRHCDGVAVARRAGIGRGHANVHGQRSRERHLVYRRGFRDARRGGGTGRRRIGVSVHEQPVGTVSLKAYAAVRQAWSIAAAGSRSDLRDNCPAVMGSSSRSKSGRAPLFCG